MFYVKTNVDQPVHFESVGIFLSDDRWRHDRRIIDSYEIIAVYSGVLSIKVNSTCYEVHPNELLIIPPFA